MPAPKLFVQANHRSNAAYLFGGRFVKLKQKLFRAGSVLSERFNDSLTYSCVTVLPALRLVLGLAPAGIQMPLKFQDSESRYAGL